MLARLLQVHAVTRTIEGDLASFTAALWADPVVQGGTEAFLFSGLTNRTTHEPSPELIITFVPIGNIIGGRWASDKNRLSGDQKPLRTGRFDPHHAESLIIRAFLALNPQNTA